MTRNNDNWYEITENNKLIAQFMGYKYYPFEQKSPNLFSGYWKKDSNRSKFNFKLNFNYLCRKHRDLKYHSDWNWLMSVIPKIKDIWEEYNSKPELGGNDDMISYDLNDGYSLFHTSKEDLYRIVVNFIKWYNDKQKIR